MCPATTGTVAEVFAEEQARLLPHAAHPFPTERLVPVRSAKTIYVRFDLNQYSIPPEAVGRQLTLAASDTLIRILEGTREIARHRRSYDRRQLVLDPAHQEAVLKSKRKTAHSTPTGRLEKLVPESKAFLDQAFAHGESAAHEAARLSKLLEQYGAHAVRPAIAEALDRSTPRSCSVAFLLRRQPRSTPLALDLSRHRQAQSLDVRPHDLETYDELARWPKAEAQERSKCSLEWRLRFSGLKSFKPMADFDWSWPKKIGRDIIDRAFTLDFLNEARNLVLVGRNGLDKTMIAQNLCHTACWRGTPCCSALPPRCWNNSTVNRPRAAAASSALTPMSGCFASTKSATYPSTTRLPTCFMKSSTAGTSASR